MKLSELQSGAKIELEIYDLSGRKIETPFVSEFEWAENDTTAYIAAPIFAGHIYPVHPGTKVSVFLFEKDGVYRFDAKVLSRMQKDSIPMLKVEMINDFQRIQRREFFRFQCSLPVKYRLYDPSGKAPFIKTYTKDLSGGGLCILIQEKVETGMLIETELFISDKDILKFSGKVVRSTQLDLGAKFKYEIGVLFSQIDTKTKEAIIGFIFQEQRRLLKKGLV